MPTVPGVGGLETVRVAPAADVYQKKTRDSAAFGVGLGNTVAKGSDLLMERQLEELARRNETEAKALDNEFVDSLNAVQSNYFKQRGKDAYDNREVYDLTVDELRQQFIGRATTPSQVEMLTPVLNARVTKAWDEGQRYANKEYEAWQDGESEGRIERAVNDVARNIAGSYGYNDPTMESYTRTLKKSAENEIDDMAARKGWGIEEKLRAKEAMYSRVHEVAIENLLQMDVDAAEAYYKEHSEEIDADKRPSLMRAMKVAKHGDLATDWGDYATLAAMSIDNREGFMAANLDSYALSNSHRAYFENLKTTTRSNRAKADEQVKTIGAAMRLAELTLKDLKKDFNPKTERGREHLVQFQGALLQEMEHYKASNDGRSPSEQEVKGMINFLLQSGEYPGSGVFGSSYFQDEGYVFQGANEEGATVLIPYDEIPEAARNSISRKLIQANPTNYRNSRPSDRAIQEAYTKMRLIELRKGE